eukprot:TRINITY_DN2080_c0_g1_i2.p1 TRINITY_DN2080_c0_g1~~TRINITY_DN2080_c0_g1_i2.p1  ORF type:complete len:196 (-),score=19.45 TRINITY_DN2080_c0_g1_i2:35-622(-)
MSYRDDYDTNDHLPPSFFKGGGSSAQILASYEAIQDYEDIKMYQDFSIPDNMLKSFFKTKSVEDMLSNLHNYNQETYIFYKYTKGLTYRATVYNYNYGHDGRKQLTIKLSHDGKFFRSNINWHKSDSFYVLDSEILKEMPYLEEIKTRLGARLIFYYSIKDRRMDIRFKKGEDQLLMITFHPGHPEFVEDEDLYI